MIHTSEAIARLRAKGRLEHARLAAQGTVRDLTRAGVVVHAAKPLGSISGWVGPISWQVWIDEIDPVGTVRARVNQHEAEIWTMDPALELGTLLDTAKDRMIAQCQRMRGELLKAAEAELAALSAG
jgi:hypothetical protein